MAFKTLYTAKATVTGGRAGHGKTDDGTLEVDLSTPEELGGAGGTGTNPEQLFAIGYAACFEGAIFGVARAENVDASDVSILSTVEIGKTADGLGLQATLDVTIPSLDDETAAMLVGKAHRVCPYSKATSGNIQVTLIANGKTLVG